MYKKDLEFDKKKKPLIFLEKPKKNLRCVGAT